MSVALTLAERQWLPDWLIRLGIRRLLNRRLNSTANGTSVDAFADTLSDGPVAVATDAANDQHYEVPAEFFQQILGPRMKYSCCRFEDQTATLAEAEERMLAITAERAEIEDGMDILELGCGWGSLTLWMAGHFPKSEITAVSNSNSQRQFIECRCQEFHLVNVNVITADMRQFACDRRFDRVVSIEMFEHMRNYQLLLKRISDWLNPSGKLFVHIFCNRQSPYFFETDGDDDWMARHFFTGGIMPSEDLFSRFQRDLSLKQQWRVSGLDYAATCREWLRQLDEKRGEIDSIFAASLPSRQASVAVQRWRIFIMACEELFRYRNGEEWIVGHYYLSRNRRQLVMVRTD